MCVLASRAQTYRWVCVVSFVAQAGANPSALMFTPSTKVKRGKDAYTLQFPSADGITVQDLKLHIYLQTGVLPCEQKVILKVLPRESVHARLS